MIASILMPASQDALHAAVALNGNNFRSRRLTARVDNTPDLPLCADAPGSRTIKITWPSPKRCLWLVYDSITEAKAMVAEFDKPTSSLLLPMFKRKLKAEFKRPKSNQTHSFMVQVNDVWLNVDPEEVKTALKCTLVEPNEPTYTESPLQKFYDRLTSIGAVSMDVVPYDGTKARATAFATFQQASRVQQAVEALDKQTPDYIAKGLVRAEPCFYTSYEVFGGLFEMVRADMEALQAGLPACTVSISQGAEPGDMVVRMGASDAQQFTRMKLRLDSLLCGELVTDNGRLVWDEYFQLESCEPRLKSLMVTSNAYVERDFLHEGVRVHGTRAKRETAKDGVIRLVKRAATAQAMISLPRRLLRSLLGAGLDKLHAEFEAKRIGLDLVTRTLAVRPTTYVDQVQERITEMVEEIREPETDDLAGHCGLCDLSVEGEGQTLGCGHVYDSECFERLLKAYIRPGFTGLRCVARVAGLEGECGAFISNETYAEVLDEEYRSYLHEAALNAYLKGPFGYGLRHCPKTHCPGVYRVLEQIPEGTGNQCPFCERWICPSCCSDFHEGVSCEEYQKMAREVRDAF
ncbi:hypothetical protein CYLTODRAFT_75623 [Cylindrobasidium torrendii FP15055 ss-10]|uniref:RING-type domain-containing protein n=1 Tax=Cylindrobasidium torrendii FP15055 ss-10 TaxID=1314674 RepID=A0A0D7B4G5_9AGAR|nr:hypothetical protein CYLTODRAFT_75623 [Cylindrobasidium torrendii FP15055 ss-10]